MRRRFLFILGAALVGLAAFVAGRLAMPASHPLTASRGVDVAFALFFAVRGVMNLRAARRR